MSVNPYSSALPCLTPITSSSFRGCRRAWVNCIFVWQNFNMALYLSLNLDRILEDFYSFHISSWIFVLTIKMIECIAMVSRAVLRK